MKLKLQEDPLREDIFVDVVGKMQLTAIQYCRMACVLRRVTDYVRLLCVICTVITSNPM